MCANWNTVCVHEVVIMSELRLNVRGSEGCVLRFWGKNKDLVFNPILKKISLFSTTPSNNKIDYYYGLLDLTRNDEMKHGETVQSLSAHSAWL